MTKPTAYVINLDRRKDRWQRTQELWSPFFDLRRVRAVELPDGARGCKLSHWDTASKVLEKEPMVIVLEDDAIPTPWWKKIGMQCLGECLAYIQFWDYVNFGPFLDLSRNGLPKAELIEISKLFLHATYSHNTHMVGYNHRSLPLLEASLSSHLPVDMFLGKNAKSQWVPCRVLATQTGSDSDIRRPFLGQQNWYAASDAMLEYASLELHPVNEQLPTVKNGIIVHHSEHHITADDVKKMEDE